MGIIIPNPLILFVFLICLSGHGVLQPLDDDITLFKIIKQVSFVKWLNMNKPLTLLVYYAILTYYRLTYVAYDGTFFTTPSIE